MGGIFFSCLWFFYGCSFSAKRREVQIMAKVGSDRGKKCCCCCIWQAVLSNHPSSFASTYGFRKWLCIQACQVNLRFFHYQIVSVGKVHLFPLENNPKTKKNALPCLALHGQHCVDAELFPWGCWEGNVSQWRLICLLLSRRNHIKKS